MRDLAKAEKSPVRHAGGDLSGDWIVGSFRMRFGHVDSTVLATADNSRGAITATSGSLVHTASFQLTIQ
jgi:hypothetical protein